MIENPTTPRERITNYLEAHNTSKMTGENVHSYGRMLNGEYIDIPLTVADLQSVLDANGGYERLIAEQRREAVEEYKKTLAETLRSEQWSKIAREEPENNGFASALDCIADNLEDGTL